MNNYRIIFIAIILVFLYVGIWLFNHVNPWFGIFITLAVIFGAIRVVYHFINKQSKKEDEK